MYTVYEAMPLNAMLARVEKYNPGDGAELVKKAYLFAQEAHKDQKRKSGEPYFIHPCFVASILTELMIDPPTIAAGLLHDTVEDCENITLETLRREFGDEVAWLVDGVTKLDKLDFADKEEAQAESLRKMIMAMAKDIRVVLIKLADRLHNMRTMKFQKPERQVAIARETLDIYAPLAHRLGVYAIKQELEDLSLRYIDPAGYQNLVQKVGQKRSERQENIRTVIAELSEKLDEMHIHYDIDGRPKHFYSIYRKMVLQNKPFDQIYDLIAIRVLVDSVPDCYMVLGIVHTLWNQIPGRFKDYISVPKGNMYQSLHTTVVGGRKLPFPFEVQIRTWEMHRVAEYGIAAHWRYKEKGSGDDLDSKLTWVRQILDWQSDTRDSKEFMDTLKTDLFAEEVFLFTPKGDVISMPKGATPLDFAYRIHSGVGNKCVGSKINGKIMPLDTTLQTGDRVEIITSASSKGPSTDWLRICKTPQAKSKIRAFLKKEFKVENIDLGRSMVERECRRRSMNPSDLIKPEFYDSIMRKYGFTQLEDIFAAVGYGGMAAVYVVSRLVEEQRAAQAAAAPKIEDLIAPQQPTPAKRRANAKAHHGIFMPGNEDMDIPVRFGRCCTPVPGDDIVGYITRGRGVTIHKADCVNALSGEEERRVEVEWADENIGAFTASIKIAAYDKPNLLVEIASIISEMNISIKNVSASLDEKTSIATFRFAVEVKSREQMDKVVKQLMKKSDVIDVFRA